MTTIRIDVRRFTVAFRRPLVTATGRLTSRAGYLVIIDDGEHRGCGEASPPYWLPGASLEDTADGLARAHAAFTEAELGRVRDACLVDAPAAACALDTALLDLAARRDGVTVAERLGGTPRPLALAALVTGATPEAAAASAREHHRSGYQCLKLKVGGDPLAADVARLRAVRDAVGPEVAIRLDANQAWQADDARAALEAFTPFLPAFVEEPLADPTPEGFRRLQGAGVPLALDESIVTARDLEGYAGLAAVLVLKAARVGGPTAACVVAAAARRAGMRVVVTDAIETSVGRALALHLAAVIGDPDEAVGLGGLVTLVRDPLATSPPSPTAVASPEGPGLGIRLGEPAA